jgi:telomerase Cajal body protein 1
VQEPGTIYDFIWYPKMSSEDRNTSFFLTTSYNQPIHAYDGFDGSLKESYKILNKQNEIQNINSLCFDLSGERFLIFNYFKRFLCGAKNLIMEMNINQLNEKNVYNTSFNKNVSQKGIFSCFDFNSNILNMFSAGNYDKSIGKKKISFFKKKVKIKFLKII